MLTGNLVRVRHARDRIVPYYLDPTDRGWLDVAEQMLDLFRGREGCSRGELLEDIEETFGDDPGQLVHQGLLKLLEDRCDFEVASTVPPEELREAVFRAAMQHRQSLAKIYLAQSEVADTRSPLARFDRDLVLSEVARQLGLKPDEVDRGLFGDLKSEQRLIHFEDISAERLLYRYNVALAQAVLLRSIRVHLAVRGESPARYRQLLRSMKFHRLVCEMERTGPDSWLFHLDGPMSLFTATQKYGLQLAMFLPSVLRCKDFELKADLRWGAQRKPKQFILTPNPRLRWDGPDPGTWTPPELHSFVEMFRKRHSDWELNEETDIFPLGSGYWVPDFRLKKKGSAQVIYLEVLGFWRKASAEQHLARLKQHVNMPFLLAVSDQLHIEEGELENLPAGIHRFRQMPLPDEIARLAEQLLAGGKLPDPAEPQAPAAKKPSRKRKTTRETEQKTEPGS